jgi:solute carrier family 35 protein C2
VSVIVAGLLLLVEGEARFDGLGFALVMGASACSGLRFVLTQVLLHGHGGEGAGGFGWACGCVCVLSVFVCT